MEKYKEESECTADHTNNNNQDGTSAGKQPPRCPQEEDEADEGGDGEVQGGERGHGKEAPGGDSPARGGRGGGCRPEQEDPAAGGGPREERGEARHRHPEARRGQPCCR